MEEIIKLHIVGIVVLFSVYTDIKYGKIFNKLTFPFFFLGFIYNGILKGLSGVINSFIGFLIAFVPFYIFFQFGGVGGGDVKLLAGLGSWLGYPAILWVIFLTAVFGLIISVFTAMLRGKISELAKETLQEGKENVKTLFMSVLSKNFAFYDKNKKFKLHIPYSVAIAMGTFTGVFVSYLSWGSIPH